MMKRFYAWGALLGAVIGAGIFALPQAAYLSGWPSFLAELFIFSLMLGYAHNLYARILDGSEEKNLLGLLGSKLGKRWFYLGLLAIFGGLLAALTGFLILGGRFLVYVFPNLSFLSAVGILWIVGSVPVFFRSKTFLSLESWGSFLKTAIVACLGVYGLMLGASAHAPQTGDFSLLLPFGPIIFALAGWTAVEPIVRDLGAKAKKANLFFWGSIFVACLYALFVFGILHSAFRITPDTVSGLDWGAGALLAVSILGLFGIWTSYLPSALEIKNSMKSAHLPRGLGLMIFLILPLVLVAYGVNNFLAVISVGGGIFVSLQYLLILRLGTKVLKPKFWEKLLIFLSAAIFLSGGLYEAIFFWRPF